MTIPISKSVRFVRGTLDAAQFIPALKNFAIEDKMIQGQDGTVTLNAAIDVDLKLRVDAVKFARAVSSCGDEDEVELSLTGAGHLRLKQGTLRVIIPALPNGNDSFPWQEPEGEEYNLPADFIDRCEAMRPFISTDATRPWALGLRLHRRTLYATNNIILAMTTMDNFIDDTAPLEDVIIPARAIDELLRIRSTLNAIPHKLFVSETSVTFMHARSWWLRSVRIQGEWPDIDALFEKAKGTEMTRVTDELREAFARLLPFAPEASPMYMLDGMLTTSTTPDEEGATIEGFEHVDCAFVVGTLKLVMEQATHVGFARYPDPVPFVGPNVRGLMAVYKMQSTGPEPTKVERSEQKTPAPPPPKARKKTTRFEKGFK